MQTEDDWNWEHLTFTVNDVEKAHLDGEPDWIEITVDMEAESHALEWTCSKDYSGAAGQDCGGFVDPDRGS